VQVSFFRFSLSALALAVSFATAPAIAADSKAVAVTAIVEHPALDAARDGVKDELKAAGFEAGKNFRFDYQSAQGNTGTAAQIANPSDSQRLGIETIYQTLALADNLDAVANLFLGRELMTRWGTLDDYAMEKAARDVFHRLNPNFKNIRVPVRSLSGGQRQVVAISRALYFNAKALIMDEPCAALGPEETRMVHDLVRKLKAQGVGIFLISHDMPDVFGLSDRLSVMKNGKTVGTYRTSEVTEDEVLGMIIAGKKVTRVAESFAPAAP